MHGFQLKSTLIGYMTIQIPTFRILIKILKEPQLGTNKSNICFFQIIKELVSLIIMTVKKLKIKTIKK